MNFDFLTGLVKTQAQEIAEIKHQKAQAMLGNYNINNQGNLNPYQQYANQPQSTVVTSTGYYGNLTGGGVGPGGYISGRLSNGKSSKP
jgi:hypothetical protein